jgi:hypothetical protein
MPIHDWTKVIAGIFHDFHHEWISTMKRALNDGLLPPEYYALAEQFAGGLGPDVLTLGAGKQRSRSEVGDDAAGNGTALKTTPPKTRFTRSAEAEALSRKRNRIAIRHRSGDEVVAVIEIVSPGNKASRSALRTFVSKAVELLEAGIHLSVIDLFPPSRRDPQGIHAAIWSEIEEDDFELPADKPLTIAAYAAGLVKRAFIEPVAVGDDLPDMPLFLDPDCHVLVPLASTYEAAWLGVPKLWRKRLEGRS